MSWKPGGRRSGRARSKIRKRATHPGSSLLVATIPLVCTPRVIPYSELLIVLPPGLPAVRALSKTWGPVAVLHFDSHLDSWDPNQLGGGISKYAEISHGSMFHILHEEGLLLKDKNMHLGARSMLFDKHIDLEHDAKCGFSSIRARELDDIGVEGVIDKIVKTVGVEYVYLSIDIDVMDPGRPSLPQHQQDSIPN